MFSVKRVDPDRVTKYGWTALEIAAINGRTEIVRLLHHHGANINLMNNNTHFTPLENAIEGGHVQTVKVMMEELSARFRGSEVAQLQSAAAVSISQGQTKIFAAAFAFQLQKATREFTTLCHSIK